MSRVTDQLGYSLLRFHSLLGGTVVSRTQHALGFSGASACPSLLHDCRHLEALWLQGCHPCSSPQMWPPQNAWVVGFESHCAVTPPGAYIRSWMSPQQRRPMRAGKAARTSGPILALSPGALPCAQLTSPCTSLRAFAQGCGSQCRGRANTHRPRGDPKGPDGKFPTDPVPLCRTSPKCRADCFRPLPCPLPPQVNGAQPCLVARSSAWPSPAPSSSSQQC